jgi:hypothetical protein
MSSDSKHESEFTKQFRSYINQYPKSLFIGNHGGNLYVEQNAKCFRNYIHDEFLSRYCSTKKRKEKTAVIDSVFHMIVQGGYQFYVYEELSASYKVCTREYSRKKFGEYVSNQAYEYKKKIKNESTDATIHNNAAVHCHPTSKDDTFTDEDDEFKDIPDNIKRYIDYIVRKNQYGLISSNCHSKDGPIHSDSRDGAMSSNELIVSTGATMSNDVPVESFSPERNILNSLFDDSPTEENLVDLTEAFDEKIEKTSSSESKKLFEFPFHVSEFNLTAYARISGLSSPFSFEFYKENRCPERETISQYSNILRRYNNQFGNSISIVEADKNRLLDSTAWLNDALIALFMLWSLRFHENDIVNQKWKVFGCPFWLWEKILLEDIDYINRYFHPTLNIFDYDVLLVQINWKKEHWTFATVVNHSRSNNIILSEILYFDSKTPKDENKKKERESLVQTGLYWFLNHECRYWHDQQNTNTNANTTPSPMELYTDSNLNFTVVKNCKCLTL